MCGTLLRLRARKKTDGYFCTKLACPKALAMPYPSPSFTPQTFEACGRLTFNKTPRARGLPRPFLPMCGTLLRLRARKKTDGYFAPSWPARKPLLYPTRPPNSRPKQFMRVGASHSTRRREQQYCRALSPHVRHTTTFEGDEKN